MTDEHAPEGAFEDDEVVQGEVITDNGAGELGLELPEDPDAAIDVLVEELTASRTSAETHLADLQRALADFDNYRKRVERDKATLVERSSERIIAALLPALDSFDNAFTTEAQTPTEEKLLAGMRSTYHQIMDILAKEGLEPIDAEPGTTFDPEVHEAVSMTPDAVGDLVVSNELRRGYRFAGKVLRPSMVAVDGG